MAKTIQLIGETGSGKTSQIGLLAQWRHRVTGKRTRLITEDAGGADALAHLIPDIIEPVLVRELELRPWNTYEKLVKGHMPDPKGPRGFSAAPQLDGICVIAIEGETSFGDGMLEDIRLGHERGEKIGGKTFVTETDGVKMAGLDQSHYGLVQSRLTRLMHTSFRLPVEYVVWTALDRRGEDEGKALVLGARAAGKALADQTPGWFNLTFHCGVLRQHGGGDPRHVLRLKHFVEEGGLKGFGNARVPVWLDENNEVAEPYTPLPSVIDPANLPKALMLIEEALEEARQAVRR